MGERDCARLGCGSLRRRQHTFLLLTLPLQALPGECCYSVTLHKDELGSSLMIQGGTVPEKKLDGWP